jgi:crotonobetainyl-CoA:carnitine CoA-transferase CaiB-like acyl-CoA transferase
MDDGILRGIRVLDFTWVLAGPYATRILADFGAEVIKVQSKKTANGTESNLTGYFNNWNRNKRAITLDMGQPEAREIVLKLAAMSDVVIENFSPRVMPNWGLDYARLKEVKSDLIMVSLSAMGQNGPWRDFVGFAPTFHALSGLTYLTSYTGEAPVGPGYAHADPMIGLYATVALLSALEYRDRTGLGQYIDISDLEAVCTLLGPTLMGTQINPKEVSPRGNHAPHIPASPYGCYRCIGADRWCVIAVFSEDDWNALRKVMADPDWTKEERFSNLSRRKQHEEELDRLLETWTSRHRCEEVVELLQEAGIAAGIVQNAEDLAADPHLAFNDFFVSMDHPVLGRVMSDRSPIRMGGGAQNRFKAAPLLGEDNRYVFEALLQFTEDEVATYIERGIIG